MPRTYLAALCLALCTAASAADPAKILHLATNDLDSLDPHQWQSSAANDIGFGIFEALYEWDYLASVPDLVPRTAAGLPEISADGKVWTIRIKPKIHFTDDPAFGGKPRELVAQDYVYSIKRALDPNLSRGGSPLLADLNVGMRAQVDAASKPGAKLDYDVPVEGLRALDRYTLQFKLVEANYPVMRSTLESAGAVAREVVTAAGGDIQTRAAGTGPYRLKEWKRGSRLVLTANPNYRTLTFPESTEPANAALVRAMRGKRLPQIGTIEFSVIEEMQPRLLEFQSGALDIATLRGSGPLPLLKGGEVDPALAARGIRRDMYPYTTRSVHFNMNDPVVGGMGNDRVALRRAIALGFDAAKASKVVYAGQAAPANQLLQQGAAGYDPARAPRTGRDPAAANALLDRFGYGKRGADGMRLAPDGKPVVLTLSTFSGTQWRELQTLWKQDMAAIGLRMEFRSLPCTDLFRESAQGKFQLTALGRGSSPTGLELITLYSRQPPDTNVTRFNHEGYDRALGKFMHAATEQERLAITRGMNDIVDHYVPILPMVVELESAFVQPWVMGFRGSPYVTYYFQYLDLDVGKQKAAGKR
jgi:ABC-type transport system substrate-binding protein